MPYPTFLQHNPPLYINLVPMPYLLVTTTNHPYSLSASSPLLLLRYALSHLPPTQPSYLYINLVPMPYLLVTTTNHPYSLSASSPLLLLRYALSHLPPTQPSSIYQPRPNALSPSHHHKPPLFPFSVIATSTPEVCPIPPSSNTTLLCIYQPRPNALSPSHHHKPPLFPFSVIATSTPEVCPIPPSSNTTLLCIYQP